MPMRVCLGPPYLTRMQDVSIQNQDGFTCGYLCSIAREIGYVPDPNYARHEVGYLVLVHISTILHVNRVLQHSRVVRALGILPQVG